MFIIKQLYSYAVHILYVVSLVGICSLACVGVIQGIAAPANQISNTTTLTAFGGNDTNAANNSATVTDYECVQADVEIVSFTDGKTSAQANQSLTYTMVIRNNGPTTLSAVAITIRTRLAFVDTTSISASVSSGSIAWVAGAPVTNYMFDYFSITGITFTSGQTVTATFSNVIVEPSGVDGQSYETLASASNNTVAFDECPPTDPVNNAEVLDYTTMERVADLAVVKTSTGGANSATSTTGTVYAGSDVTYTLSITNNGPSQAAGTITLVDSAPSQLTPIDQGGGNYTTSSGWTCSYASPYITCTNTSNIANGGSSSIVISATIAQTY